MEEGKDEVVKAKSAPAMAPSISPPPQNPNPDANPNPNPNPNPKVREEGELSSSDDDELPTCSVPPSTNISAAPSISVENASGKTYVQGKSVSGNVPARTAATQSQRVGYHKRFGKNQVLLKPRNPGWRASNANSNLVISFSDDDDSGSDGEERRQESGQAMDIFPQVVKGSCKPPALPNVKLNNVGKTARNDDKVAPKKVSLSNTFMSSMTKMNGSSVRNGGSSLAKQRSSLKNSNIARRSSSQDRGCIKNVDLSDSKLRNLRQQIAMRESELKLKIVQKNKENFLESYSDVNVVTQNKDISKKCREVPTDVQTEHEEPAKKRLKIAPNNFEQPCSSGRHAKLAESVLVLREPLIKSSARLDGNTANRVHHDSENSLSELLLLPEGRQLLRSQSKGSKVPPDVSGVTVSCSPLDCISKDRGTLARAKQTASLTNSTFADPLDKSNQGVVSKNRPSAFGGNQDMLENNMNKGNDHCGAVPAHEKLKFASDNSLQAHALHVSDGMFESSDVFPDNVQPMRSLRMSGVSGCGEVDVHSLFEIEELHDKELEEAQECRRRCEVEERNALKAYRRAQRALADANARCTYLYHRRELYSAQLRSLVMQDSSLLWSSGEQMQTGDTWNLSNIVANVNLDLIPTSSHQTQAEFEAGNQIGYDSNAQSADGDAHYRFSGNEDGHNLVSEACSEPDASSSGLVVQGNSSAANGVNSQSNDQNLSPDYDDGLSPLEHKSIHADVTFPREDDISKESEKNLNVDSKTSFPAGGSRDPLLLEAYLRSKLFSRLGMTDSSKQSGLDANSESATERAAEEDAAGAKTPFLQSSRSLSDHKIFNGDCGGPMEPEGIISKTLLDVQNWQHVPGHSLNDSPDPVFDLENSSLHYIYIPPTSSISSSSIFRSAMKAAGPVNSDDMLVSKQHGGSLDMSNDTGVQFHFDQDMLCLDVVSSVNEVVKYARFGKIDSYIGKPAIDPFWPLCMYELRGRCNNDECPWQHMTDHFTMSAKHDSLDSADHSSMNANQHDSLDSAEMQNGSSSSRMQRGCRELSSVLTPPRYLVSLDGLKAESDTFGCLQTRQILSTLKGGFSNSLAVSSSLLKHLPSDDPYLHGNDGRLESYGGAGQAYFQSRNSIGNALQNGSADTDQSIETALLVLNQETNKFEGAKKALYVLSRALEANPVSLHLWILYLLLYYSTKRSVGDYGVEATIDKDDLFSSAVKHNEMSYELWLLYINSRIRLDDRFAAYERALSSMCNHASDGDGHRELTSAAILDLFLQMLYCFCMSGNVAKAVQRIYGLVLTDRDFDESHSLLLSDILECLTISDKCIFWVCCVYLVIYRKIPDVLVQKFEFEKDKSVMEWTPVRLTLEEKQQVSKLTKVAVDSVGLLIDSKSFDSHALKSVHMMAVNHVKLMAVIEGDETYKMFLEKYRNSYPSCLELVLLWARAQGYATKTDATNNFEGFEEALRFWPKELPGIQCIWNQYAEYAIESGKPDMAKEIMGKWFHSAWKPLFLHNQMSDAENGADKSCLEDPMLGSNLNSVLTSSNKDLIFGLLNLSLYRLFQNDVLEAQWAIDKALSVSDPEMLRHCVKEHAVFLLNNGSLLKKDFSFCGLLDFLKVYMIHARATPVRDPLTRKFIKDMQKPRLRQLVSNVLSPILPDSLLVNSVLDIWFGSSLLPQNFSELRELVDLVEAILEISPGNYQLVLSVGRLLCGNKVDSNAKSTSVLFWASSLLVNTIYHTVPVPPEYVWTEAADLLGKLTGEQEISESFHRRALSVYPFSMKLWKSFLNLSTASDKKIHVREAARNKGIELI